MMASPTASFVAGPASFDAPLFLPAPLFFGVIFFAGAGMFIEEVFFAAIVFATIGRKKLGAEHEHSALMIESSAALVLVAAWVAGFRPVSMSPALGRAGAAR